MTLLRLDLERFRCIQQARLDFAPHQNLIVGANASGKTSLLEAIFLLGTGHSFKTHQTDLLIKKGEQDFIAVAKVDADQGIHTLGIRGHDDHKELRMNGEASPIAEFAQRLPVQIIDPDVHRLLEDGPIRRRRYLDWGVFHVEPRFHDTWRRYQRALRQRNAALRAKHGPAGVRLWDQEIVEHGTRVAEFRDAYVGALKNHVRALSPDLLEMELEISHQRGWRKNLDLEGALFEALPRDQLRGSTSVGPHRADLLLKVAEFSAKDRVSRGQQKMLACTLMLAQQAHRAAIGARPACLLLDDPAAELDVDNLGKLMKIVAKTKAQLIVTALTPELLNDLPEARLFHVEHGSVSNGIMP